MDRKNERTNSKSINAKNNSLLAKSKQTGKDIDFIAQQYHYFLNKDHLSLIFHFFIILEFFL